MRCVQEHGRQGVQREEDHAWRQRPSHASKLPLLDSAVYRREEVLRVA